MFSARAGWAAFLSVALLPIRLGAESVTPNPPPDAAWFQPPEWRSPRLSPDGTSIAVLRDTETSTGLWILPADASAGGRRPLRPDSDGRVADVVWSGPSQVVLLTLDGSNGGTFWAAPTRDGNPQALKPPHGATFVRLLHPQPRTPGRVWIEGIAPGHSPRAPRGRWLDLLAVDTASGQIVHHTRNPGDVVQWLVDDSGLPRVALAVRGTRQELRIANPPSARDPWRTAATFDVVHDPVSVAGIASDGTQVWIAARLGRDTIGLHALDLTLGRITRTLVSDDRFDVDGRLLASRDGLVSQSWPRLQPHTAWFDARWADATRRAQAGDPSAVGSPVDLSWDGSRAVFEVTSDRQPARFAVVSRDGTPRVELFPTLRSDSPPMGRPQTPVEFAARDGQVLTAYLTRPADDAPGPLLVLAHGGPWNRDVWGGLPEVQFFAARGWTVLQVNYRGSSGFGRAFQELPEGRWSGLPTRDLVDGARWAIGQGFAIPTGSAIVGASFGGHLALMALTGAPDVFHAGASLEGIFDLRSWLRQSNRHEPEYVRAVQSWRLRGAGPFVPWNPRRLLADLRSPLLLIHATDDAVVPASQSIELDTIARSTGAPVELQLRPRGGHTLGTPTQQATAWAAAEQFLSRAVRGSPPD